MAKGNGVRPVVAARDAVTRWPGGHRVTALMALVFVAALILLPTGTRETPGSKACNVRVRSGQQSSISESVKDKSPAFPKIA